MADQYQNPANPAAAEKQDLHIAETSRPDQNWARMQPIEIKPSQERLDKPHQLVSIKNNSPDQLHIIIDRKMHGHELQPGQTKHDIDMLASEIEYFLGERDPSRRDNIGRPKPIHPIEIIGVKMHELEKPTEQSTETLKLKPKDARAA
jgi:hypothetical protein